MYKKKTKKKKQLRILRHGHTEASEIPPGIIMQAIEMKPKNKAYILSVDEKKKLAPGLSK